MTGSRKLSILLLLAALLFPLGAEARAEVLCRVRVIHASDRGNHTDPALRDVSRNLTSVFRYTAYRLVNQRRMQLAYGRTGTMALPGGRRLQLTPMALSGRRIKFKIGIVKGGRAVFRTEVMLRDGGSVTIGGPPYKDGVLLFNIAGSSSRG